MSVQARFRILVAVLVAGLIFGMGPTPPASAKMTRIIHITLTSYKFEPDLFFMNEGDTVVLQLDNTDRQRPHAFSSPYLSQVDFAVTGQFAQGVTTDGNKYVRLETGQKSEITFVAKGRGQFGFICSIAGPGYNHAARGQTGAFVVWPAGYHLTTQ